MNINVKLAGGLARAAGVKNASVEALILHEVLEQLAVEFGEEFRDRLFNDVGKPRRFINIYVNGRDHRFLNRLDTELQEGDTISVIPAVSGG
jgi:molybdopterin converting factor small subunit